MNGAGESGIVVPREVYDALVASQGVYYERLSGVERHKIAADLLDETKPLQQAAILQRFVPLRGARLLEVGCGVGTNLVVWSKRFGADVTGVEPDAAGFEASFKLAQSLMVANALPERSIVNAAGEKLPFPDASFDIVFSANVLEHTAEPIAVLHEALRVLRPGGTLQFVFPNHWSYYDGHYGVFHPPILWPGFFPWYVRWIWRRDPEFARTLRTELNAGWTRRALRELARNWKFETLGLGQDVFRERMVSLDFGAFASLGNIKHVLKIVGHPRVRAMLAAAIIALRGWTPMIVTLRKFAP